MNLRGRKLTALLLAVSMILCSNVSVLAGIVGAEGSESYSDREAVILNSPSESGGDSNSGNKADSKDSKSGNAAHEPTTAAQEAMSGVLNVILGAPKVRLYPNGTVPKSWVDKAIVEEMIIKVRDRNREFYVKNNCLYEEKGGNAKPVFIDYGVDRWFTISLNGIRKAGSNDFTKYPVDYDAKSGLVHAHGNEIVNYSVILAKNSAGKNILTGVKDFKKIEGEMLIKTPYSGTVSHQYVYFGENGKYRLKVDYDGAVEYRGTKVSVTSHFLTSGTNPLTGLLDNPVNGVVDGAVGVSAVIEEKVSSNGGWRWRTLERQNEPYYWKTDSGITLKKPKLYNSKKVGAYYDDNGPFFRIKMTFSKKAIVDDPLTIADKQELKNKLRNEAFSFTIEPRPISTKLITYVKNDANKYYVGKKLTYDVDKKTLKGTVQFMGEKKNKSTLNARKTKKLGKKLNIYSKSDYDDGRSPKSKKADVIFEMNKDTGDAVLTAVNGYYGTAVIKESKISRKYKEDDEEKDSKK